MKSCRFLGNSLYFCNQNIHLNKLDMKKTIVSAMMIIQCTVGQQAQA